MVRVGDSALMRANAKTLRDSRKLIKSSIKAWAKNSLQLFGRSSVETAVSAYIDKDANMTGQAINGFAFAQYNGPYINLIATASSLKYVSRPTTRSNRYPGERFKDYETGARSVVKPYWGRSGYTFQQSGKVYSPSEAKAFLRSDSPIGTTNTFSTRVCWSVPYAEYLEVVRGFGVMARAYANAQVTLNAILMKCRVLK